MNRIIVIIGPTGTGKTKMSIELAKKLNGEIINADSTQVYRGLDIATAKIVNKEGIKHHLMDIRNITEDYTVYDYQIDCRNAIDSILRINKTPIIVGGTGLYIKSALCDYRFNKNQNKGDYSKYSKEELYNMLISIDPTTDIHQNNRKRVERALDYYNENKSVMSSNNSGDNELYNALYIGLTADRKILYDRINTRVEQMLKEGLLKEAKIMYDSNIRTKAVMTPIGYKELFPYFDGKESLEICIDKIKQNTRNYAKKQYTWIRNKMEVKWFDVNFDSFDKTVSEVLGYIKDVKN